MKRVCLSFMSVTSIFLWPIVGLTVESDNICLAENYAELVRCAERTSSEIRISEQQVKSAQVFESVAREWTNPELDAETVSKGSEAETSATLLFNLRLGGKREALLKGAQSESERARAQRDFEVNRARLDFMLGLYRLSHLQNEIHIEEESIATFSEIVNQFQRRPALSPEQDISLSVFKMALADHAMQLTRLKIDQEKIYHGLMAFTGIDKIILAKNLPPVKEAWPEIAEMSADQSPQVRTAVAELKLAQSQKAGAEGESWPDLKIGPTIKAIKGNSTSETFVGLGLSLPLPVFNQNRSGRAYSAQKLIVAEMSLAQTKKLAQTTRDELTHRYTQIVQGLKNSLSLKTINEKHQQLDRQFFNGLVPSSLVIEAHRQIFELEERRNASVLEALEALGEIYILDNKFSEVVL